MRPYSFTKLSTYTKCPRWYKFSYIDGRPEFRADTFSLGSEVHRAIAHFLQTGEIKIDDSQLLPSQADLARTMVRKAVGILDELGQAVAVEYQFALDDFANPVGFNDPSALVRGIIDLVTISDGGYYIWDWKTGKSQKADALQLKIYILAGSVLFGDDIIGAGFVYLPSATTEIIYNDYRLDSVWKNLMELIGKIERDTEFVPSPGTHCYYCPHVTYCPMWEYIQQTGVILASDAEAVELAKRLDYLKGLTKQLESLLAEYLSEKGTVEHDGYVLALSGKKVKIQRGGEEDGSVQEGDA